MPTKTGEISVTPEANLALKSQIRAFAFPIAEASEESE